MYDLLLILRKSISGQVSVCLYYAFTDILCYFNHYNPQKIKINS
jgi:hypothetical protein